MSELIFNGYTKILKGRTILDNINCSFSSGRIYGLYGRNGSGKTMLLRAAAGLIFPTAGEVVIDGRVLHKDISFPPSIGVIIENAGLLPQYDAFTNLKILSQIKRVASDNDIRAAITAVGLDANSRAKVRTYSLGMRQKLSIAQAIFEKPQVLLLDEPTNALDEESIILTRKLLVELKERGTLIILASHNKEDLELLSDEKIKITEGRIAMEG